MDVTTCIKKRKSCRDYTDKTIPHHILGEILDTARLAPSAGNTQSWHIIIVTKEKTREDIASACIEQTWMKSAPVHLVICNEKEKLEEYYDERGETYGTQHCAIIATYITLLAEEHGLGTCWVGGFDNERIKRILNIPDTIEPEVIITLGYPGMREPAEPRHELKAILSFESYGKKDIPPTLLPLRESIERLGTRMKKHVETTTKTLTKKK